MEIKIGVTQSPREIEVDMGDDFDAEALIEEVQSAIAEDSKMLWFTDRRGRRVGVPAGKLAYVEIGATGVATKVGFSAS